LRKFIILALGCAMLFTAALFAGPVSSGALLLLRPAPYAPRDHDLPEDYEPVHDGGISLATGVYGRTNEDLVVRGTPALILRRAYLSGYRVAKQFGIGATHDGEIYVHGDGERFQWAELIQAEGSRIGFRRTSPGASVMNAMYRHRGTPGEWDGAQLGWTGGAWALRRLDGSLDRFQPCGVNVAKSCSIIESRDADGHSIHHRRDPAGRLLKMAAGPRWIAFDYDAKDRVVRAHTSTGQEARYEYDERGRMVGVASGASQSRYTYTDRDELATIEEPGTSIENIYDANGRCIKQINRYPDGSSYVFTFEYELKEGAVVRTNTTQSDGGWTTYAWNDDHYSISEARGRGAVQDTVFTYDRDPQTNRVTGLTLTCSDRTGRPIRRSSIVRDNEAWLKRDLVQTYCAKTRR
jgi:YD repeat-containing protein